MSGVLSSAQEPPEPWACTSFAVYSGEPLYGMNFDYPEVPIRFTIREFGDLKVFQMEFKDGGGYTPTVGMNSSGLFASSQMLFPEMPSTSPGSTTPLTLWQLYQAGLYRNHTTADVLGLIDDYQITNSSLTLHDLFADPGGEAIVVEVIDNQEEVTPIVSQYIVMTNFPLSPIQGLPLDEIEGVGADRYITASRMIQENLDNFQVDVALKILEEAALMGEYSTQASMVFDPVDLEVFIALDRDFNTVWRVSLAENSISTWQGFESRQTLPLDHQGVTEKTMIEMGKTDQAEHIPLSDLLLPAALLSIAVLVIYSLKRNSRNQDRGAQS